MATDTVTPTRSHPSQRPEPLHPDSAGASLFPPINQGGHFPLPMRPMTRHAAAPLSRQAKTALTATKPSESTPSSTPSTLRRRIRPPADAEAGMGLAPVNQRKRDAVQQLAPLAEALDDIEARIDELVARTRRLELS